MKFSFWTIMIFKIFWEFWLTRCVNSLASTNIMYWDIKTKSIKKTMTRIVTKFWDSTTKKLLVMTTTRTKIKALRVTSYWATIYNVKKRKRINIASLNCYLILERIYIQNKSQKKKRNFAKKTRVLSIFQFFSSNTLKSESFETLWLTW